MKSGCIDGKRYLSVIANLPKEFYHEKSPAFAGLFAIKTQQIDYLVTFTPTAVNSRFHASTWFAGTLAPWMSTVTRRLGCSHA